MTIGILINVPRPETAQPVYLQGYRVIQGRLLGLGKTTSSHGDSWWLLCCSWYQEWCMVGSPPQMDSMYREAKPFWQIARCNIIAVLTYPPGYLLLIMSSHLLTIHSTSHPQTYINPNRTIHQLTRQSNYSFCQSLSALWQVSQQPSAGDLKRQYGTIACSERLRQLTEHTSLR